MLGYRFGSRMYSLVHLHLIFSGVVCILSLQGRQEQCPFTTRLRGLKISPFCCRSARMLIVPSHEYPHVMGASHVPGQPRPTPARMSVFDVHPANRAE